jgi:DNA-binding MarR family transcriptional regulator
MGARRLEQCNCLALRQAARHVTQFYDQHLARSGLRTTQFSILAKLQALGPLSINELAAHLVMDRTTLGRNIRPLTREGLIEIAPGRADRRVKEVRLSKAGVARMRAAMVAWKKAQARFEDAVGPRRASDLRGLLRDVVSCSL